MEAQFAQISVIPLGEKIISSNGKGRYKISLPQSLNSIWSALHGKKVEVLLSIKAGASVSGTIPLTVGISRAGAGGFVIKLPTSLSLLWEELNIKKIRPEILIRLPRAPVSTAGAASPTP